MIYYTGAKKSEERQDNPSLSLGGFKSSSQVPNGAIHNVFPKITQSTVIKNHKIIRMIVLHNPSTTTMSNIRLWSEDGEFSKILLTGILPAYDAECDVYYFEEVANEASLPYQGTLAQYTEATPFTIPELLPTKTIGIWLRKELDLDKFNDLDKGQDELSCEATIEILQQEEQDPILEDNVKINIVWD